MHTCLYPTATPSSLPVVQATYDINTVDPIYHVHIHKFINRWFRELSLMGIIHPISETVNLSAWYPLYQDTRSPQVLTQYVEQAKIDMLSLGNSRSPAPTILTALNALLPKLKQLSPIDLVSGYNRLTFFYQQHSLHLGLFCLLSWQQDTSHFPVDGDASSRDSWVAPIAYWLLDRVKLSDEASFNIPIIDLGKHFPLHTCNMLLHKHSDVAELISSRPTLSTIDTMYSSMLKTHLPHVAIRAGKVLPIPRSQGLGDPESLLFKVHAFAPTLSIRTCRNRRQLKFLNKLFPPTSNTDNKHMTTHLSSWMWHFLHTNPRPDLVTGPVTMNGRPFALHTVRKRIQAVNQVLSHIPIGTNQILTLSLLIMVLGHKHGSKVYDQVLHSRVLFTSTHKQKEILKTLGTLYRKCSFDTNYNSLSNTEVCALSYLDLLFGRSAFTSDWNAEVANRTTGTVHLQTPSINYSHTGVCDWVPDSVALAIGTKERSVSFYKELRVHIDRISSLLVTKRNSKESFFSFYQRRHEWMASGSSSGFALSHSHLKAMPIYDVRLNGVKAQKRAWAECTSYAEFLHHLATHRAEERAVGSEKMESGKSRAIYGVDPYHYCYNTYATKGFEERLHLIPGFEKGATGPVAIKLENNRADITSDPSVECTMLDYADFNRHHTPLAQAEIFNSFATRGEAIGSHPDWINANKWVAQSKTNMWLTTPHHPRPIRVTQGMFSGTRSTDLINTILNASYYLVAADYVANQFLLSPDDLYRVHQGDDVWLSQRDPLWARVLYYSLNSMGLVFQPSKQMFGVGRGEYLRVLYGGGAGNGYFARALSNYILRPVQNATSIDPLSWAKNIRESVALLMRRGLTTHMAQILCEDGHNYWVVAKGHSLDHKPVRIPKSVVHAPPIKGGLGASPPGLTPILHHCPIFESLPEIKSEAPSLVGRVPQKMTDDWIRHISSLPNNKLLGHLIHTESLRYTMVNDNYRDVRESAYKDKGAFTFKKSVSRRLSSWNKTCPMANTDSPSEIIDCLRPQGMDITAREQTNIFWRNHLSLLESKRPLKVRPYREITDIMQKVVIRSRFKNEKRMMQAHNLDLIDALTIIISEAGSASQAPDTLRLVVGPLLR